MKICTICKELAHVNNFGLCRVCVDQVNSFGMVGGENKTPTSRPKQLAKDHWSYIEALLSEHGVQYVDMIGFHYKTAFEHGYKHAMEDK